MQNSLDSKLTDTEKAYIAGFIDGEGYVGLTTQIKKETTNNSASRHYHPYLIIANNNSPVLIYIKDLIGEGKIYKVKRNASYWKDCFQYKLTKMSTLESLLSAIEPYLVIKKKQAKLLMEYVRIRKSKELITGAGSRGITSFGIEEEQLHKKLLLLNKRGTDF